METNLPQMLTDVGFPIGLCLILLYGFKKVGEVLLARVVDPVITSHREFLVKLEQQPYEKNIYTIFRSPVISCQISKLVSLILIILRIFSTR